MVGLTAAATTLKADEPEEVVGALKYAAAIRVVDGEVYADDCFERIAGCYPERGVNRSGSGDVHEEGGQKNRRPESKASQQ